MNVETKQDPIVLLELTPAEIADALGIKTFQGKQIFQWIHRRRDFDFASMTNLSKALRETLTARCVATHLKESRASFSESTGTRKILLELGDGETVEAVFLRDRDRVTLCLSSQVGCAVKCSFCATGLSGFARNLSAGEIAGQALHLLRDQDLGGRSPNIVYMGMGEPFRNYDAMVKSIRLLMDADGLKLGARRITVSTAGEAPGIRRFADEDWQVRLSLSLHAANDTLRDELVPLNRKYNLHRLRTELEYYQARTGRQVTFEWTLMQGVNDSAACAEELAAWARGLDAHVNLIPYNPVRGLEYRAPGAKACAGFRDALEGLGVNATLRVERGQDIDAACGQLRRSSLAGAQ